MASSRTLPRICLLNGDKHEAMDGVAAGTGPVGAKDDRPVLTPPYEDSPCWVSIFGGKNFQPPAARLTGPTYVKSRKTQPVDEIDLRNVGGRDFIDRIDSLIVGPRARITIYDRPRYSGRQLSFGPGERVPDLAVHGFDNRIESIKVVCE